MDFEQLRRGTAEADEAHRDAMRTIHDELGEAHYGGDADAVAARRAFLRRAAAGATIVVGSSVVPLRALLPTAGAQSADTAGTGDTTPGLEGTPSTLPGVVPSEEDTIPTSDLELVLFAESIELALRDVYQLVDDRRVLDPAPAETARRFGRHHHEHAVALSELAVVQESVDPELVAPNQAFLAELTPEVATAIDQQALVRLLFDLEQAAAATYTSALGAFESRKAAGGAGTIQPVEAQHAAVWGQFLELPIGEWMPAFQSQDDALDPSTYAA